MVMASMVHHPLRLSFSVFLSPSPTQFLLKRTNKESHFTLLPGRVSLRLPRSCLLECNSRVHGRNSKSISCYSDTEQDAFTSSEYFESKGSQTDADINTSRSIHNISSFGEHKESNPEARDNYISSSIKTVVFWVCAAVTFGTVVGFKEGVDKASEFFAGYLLEQSLSVDNLFVFVLIFQYFQVPPPYQGRVLSYGIAGAIIFRAIMIFLGTATIERFEVINVLLAAVLLYSAYKLFDVDDEEEDLSNNFILKICQKLIPVTSSYDGDRFFTVQNGVRKATPLLLTVAVIELSDIAFAVDSIPAVFGVTHDPFIVFSSNLFAIVGLRSLYTLISTSMTQLEYLQPSIGIVLGFIGSKMILNFVGYHISTEVSLCFVALSLGAGILLSLTKKSDLEK